MVAGLNAQIPTPPRYPPPGKMVDAGGYRVHLNCVGHGTSTVMIVGAGYSFDWSLVQPEVAKFARACTYDPSGSAWSEPNPAPTCDGRVQEIHTMLRNAGIIGPVVLVGHSIGAVFARMYAATYPSDVSGMVLIDHAGRYRMNFRPGTASEDQSLQKLPPAARDMHTWAASLSNRGAEIAFFNRCIAEVEKRPLPASSSLGSKPLVVVADESLTASEDYQTKQTSLLALSRNSSAMVAPNSSHSVPIDAPEVIVQAIRQVVSAALH